jgi:hypothetical protein
MGFWPTVPDHAPLGNPQQCLPHLQLQRRSLEHQTQRLTLFPAQPGLQCLGIAQNRSGRVLQGGALPTVAQLADRRHISAFHQKRETAKATV